MHEDARHVFRRSPRLRDYDYSQPGAYFVTVCAWQRGCLFGAVVDDEVRLSSLGEIVRACWDEIPNHRRDVELDAFVIMPNHFHAIVVILDQSKDAAGNGGKVSRGLDAGDTSVAPTAVENGERRPTLGAIVGAFKAAVTRTARERGVSVPIQVWQRSYYEHVIRSEAALSRIRNYIFENPAKWSLDRDNPATWRPGDDDAPATTK